MILDRYNLTTLNQDLVNYINNPIASREIEVIIKSLPPERERKEERGRRRKRNRRKRRRRQRKRRRKRKPRARLS